MLLLTYVCYVLFMKINASAERTVTKFLYKNKVTRVRSTDHLVPGVSHLHTRGFSPNMSLQYIIVAVKFSWHDGPPLIGMH